MRGDDPEGIRLKTNRTHLLLSLSPGHLHFLPLAPGLSSYSLTRNSHGNCFGTESYSKHKKGRLLFTFKLKFLKWGKNKAKITLFDQGIESA